MNITTSNKMICEADVLQRRLPDTQFSNLFTNTLPYDIKIHISKFLQPNLRPFIQDIMKSDTYCIDKGRLCWGLHKLQFQIIFCLKCGDYLLSQTDNTPNLIYCKCDYPLEDLHGDLMMSIEYYGKTGNIF